MSDNQVLNKAKCDEAIKQVCDVMDNLELTLTERWYVVHCVEVAARNMLGSKFAEICEKYSDDLGVEPSESV